MNFKPNLWKIIGSFALSILSILIASIFISSRCMSEIGGSCPFISYETFTYLAVYLFLPVSILMYLIWSLVERK